jgi:1-acylglycerone phosphate reductase
VLSNIIGTYAASKRSIELVAETLRLEVAPFGVDVISVVTGGVRTLGQTYFEDFAVPSNSLYKPIESTIVSRAQGGDGMPRMDLEEYSRAVADAIIQRTAGKFWYGQNAEMVKMSTTATAVPQSAMVSLVTPFPSPLTILILIACRMPALPRARAWTSWRKANEEGPN